jgi:hypothetical protein
MTKKDKTYSTYFINYENVKHISETKILEKFTGEKKKKENKKPVYNNNEKITVIFETEVDGKNKRIQKTLFNSDLVKQVNEIIKE